MNRLQILLSNSTCTTTLGVGVTTKELPITLLDAVVQVVDGAATTTFQPAEYHIATIEVGRCDLNL
jgi:hypothetical protein